MINRTYLKPKYFMAFLIVLALIPPIINGQTKDDVNTVYKILDLKQEIASGKDKEVTLLFEDQNAKVAQIILRNGNRLKAHSVEESILIQCTNGKGELLIENGKMKDKIQLNPGAVVSIKGNVLHDVIADPEISILLIRFTNKNNNSN